MSTRTKFYLSAAICLLALGGVVQSASADTCPDLTNKLMPASWTIFTGARPSATGNTWQWGGIATVGIMSSVYCSYTNASGAGFVIFEAGSFAAANNNWETKFCPPQARFASTCCVSSLSSCVYSSFSNTTNNNSTTNNPSN